MCIYYIFIYVLTTISLVVHSSRRTSHILCIVGYIELIYKRSVYNISWRVYNIISRTYILYYTARGNVTRVFLHVRFLVPL